MINGLDELLELVNTQNDLPTVITEHNVIIDSPRPILPYTVVGQGSRNTAVGMKGIDFKGYTGETEVYYRRGDLTGLFAGLDPELRAREFTVESVLGHINSRYGLQLELRDLQPVTVPSFEGDPLETIKYAEYRVIDGSYRWLGTVTIQLTYGNPLLTTVVFVQLLPILKHPDDLDLLNGRLSGRMQTWGYDFTGWKDRLNIDPVSGEWADFADVQDVGREAGIPYWYNSPVVDLPTTAVPESNPDFERVMVQHVTLGAVKGPLYFHYDANW